MKHIWKALRILTLAPILAAVSLVCIYCMRPEVFPCPLAFIFMLFYLGLLPLLAYPLQPFIPRFKEKGRDGQRTLAMLLAVCGYVLCALNCVFTHATAAMWLITVEYLLSGLLILLFNKVLHIKLSAHGCGSAGPVFLLLYFGLWLPALMMALMTFLACISSVKMKRHTGLQLLGGSLVSVLLLGVLAPIFHLL